MLAVIGCAWAVAGCGHRIDWPDRPTARRTTNGLTSLTFRIDRSERPNYIQRLRDGRIVTLDFDDDADGVTDESVDLTRPIGDSPHFVIVLDGVPFEVVDDLRAQGHFRLFGPPVRLVSVFPAMTDLALSRLFRTKPCVAAEALFFDRQTNSLSDANDVYLSGRNAPWRDRVQYRAPQGMAVTAYLNPAAAFATELREMHKLFRRTEQGRAIAYSVGTAGLGTRHGKPAIRDYLIQIDRLCERITYDRRGRVRFTLLADHGHTLKQCERISFRRTLTDAGYRVTKSLDDPNDVVVISYGLVTCARFHTDRPRAVAEALLGHPAAELATFVENDAVVVRSGSAEARIEKRPGGFTYDDSRGDPLDLRGVLVALRDAGHVSSDGVIADRPLLDATASHRYPDPLHRLWTCFHGLVEKPADLIVSLDPAFCHGSKLLHFIAGPVASTHGGLSDGSVTFLMTNAVQDPIPAVIRVDDVADLIASER